MIGCNIVKFPTVDVYFINLPNVHSPLGTMTKSVQLLNQKSSRKNPKKITTKVQQVFKLKIGYFCGCFVLLINWLWSLYNQTLSGFTSNLSIKLKYNNFNLNYSKITVI